MAPHIAYEWQMLDATAIELASMAEGPVKNALLEAFLLHARQLVDFLCGSGQKDADNCYAKYYCNNGWTEPQVVGPLADARTAVNKYVGHITVERLTARAWDVPAIYDTLRSIVARFRLAASVDIFPAEELQKMEPMARADLILVTGTTTTTGFREMALPRKPTA